MDEWSRRFCHDQLLRRSRQDDRSLVGKRGLLLASVVEWCRACKFFEPLYKGAMVVETAVDRDLRNACCPFLERFHRVMQTDLLHERVGRHF